MAWARAGHLPPVRCRGGTAGVLSEGGGIPLGVHPDASYREAEVELRPGDLLALCTDGLIERPRIPLDVGIDRLRRLLEFAGSGTAAGISDAVRHELIDAPPRDDVGIVVVRVR